jgi:hypothetical protein
MSRRRRLYAVGIASAGVAITLIVGGYLYLIWLHRIVERITD